MGRSGHVLHRRDALLIAKAKAKGAVFTGFEWQEKYRARPADEARDSIYTDSYEAAYEAAAQFEKEGRRPLVEQLYGPVYTIPLREQKR